MLYYKQKILSFAFILGSVTFSAYAQSPQCSHAKSFSGKTFNLDQVADSRLDLYDVRHVFLDLHADNLSTHISGDATLLLEAKGTISTVVLELSSQINVTSVQINNVSATYIHTGDLLEVTISNEITSGEIFTCKITYEGEPNPGSGIFSGINNATSQTWENQVTWTLSEPFNAKLWWPCKQVLTDKIDSVWVFVTTDEDLKVGSNGILTNTVPLPENKVRYEWKSNYPIAYYLISMTIAEYVEYNNYAKPAALNGSDSILIQNYIYDNPETLPYYKDELDKIPDMVELFSDYYVLYPFYEEKYGHAMAPFGGGMEHQTMSSMGIFSFTLDAHELGHQWFGDLVTCDTWQDIWINEGFARFSEYLALEKLVSQYGAEQYRLSDMDVVLGTMNGSVYVPQESANDENRIFSYVLTYLKGGLIIHMIREIVNDDEVFFEVLETFLEQYRHSTATGEDFKDVLEAVTGSQFDEFFDQWYYGEGYPIFDITWRTSTDSLFITSQQTTTSTTKLFSTPLEFAINYESGETDTFRISQSQNLETFSLRIDGPVRKLTFDPDNWLINGLDRFVRVDEQGNALSTDLITKNLIIYPNPANREIFFNRRLSKIRIYDTTGRKVYSEGASVSKIEISNLTPGFYLLEAEADGQPVKRRIIVE